MMTDSEIESLIARLEANERSDDLDKLISRALGYKGTDTCPPYSHQSPLLRMATISRLQRILRARRGVFL